MLEDYKNSSSDKKTREISNENKGISIGTDVKNIDSNKDEKKGFFKTLRRAVFIGIFGASATVGTVGAIDKAKDYNQMEVQSVEISEQIKNSKSLNDALSNLKKLSELRGKKEVFDNFNTLVEKHKTKPEDENIKVALINFPEKQAGELSGEYTSIIQKFLKF